MRRYLALGTISSTSTVVENSHNATHKVPNTQVARAEIETDGSHNPCLIGVEIIGLSSPQWVWVKVARPSLSQEQG